MLQLTLGGAACTSTSTAIVIIVVVDTDVVVTVDTDSLVVETDVVVAEVQECSLLLPCSRVGSWKSMCIGLSLKTNQKVIDTRNDVGG